jgi:predicted amidohydrolase YtcJ
MVSADTIFKNARVITMNPKSPLAEMVAVKGNKVLCASGAGEIPSLTGPGTRIIDCEGKTVSPGFIDAHCHIFGMIRDTQALSLRPPVVTSIEDIKALVSNRIQNTPAGKWITGANYDEFYFEEGRHPVGRDIDGISPRNPVVLFHRSLHACVLNSPAMKLIGITNETPEPDGGTIGRDIETGKPDGRLFNMNGYVLQKMPPPSMSEMNEGFTWLSRHFLSRGITSVHEASPNNNPNRWEQLKDAGASGSLKNRVYMLFGYDSLDQFQEMGLARGAGDDCLRLGGVKVMLGESGKGLHPSQAELNHQITRAHKSGFQVAIHAVTPVEVEAAITALERVYSSSRQSARHRIEHCSECPPRLFERVCKIKAAIVTQPPFLYYSGDRYLATISPDHIRWLYRAKSFLDAGLVVAASSDGPVTPPDPLLGMYAAITRKSKTGRVVAEAECVSPAQALAMQTVNGAYLSFEENLKGSLSPGKLADMVLLSDNPLHSAPGQIKDIKVEMTVVGGEIVWEA